MKSLSEDEIIKENYGLVVAEAMSFLSDPSESIDDFIQVGLIGLLYAVRNHDEKKSKFSKFARICIRNHIAKLTKKPKTEHLDTELLDNNSMSFSEYIPDSLTDIQKLVLEMKRQGYTYFEISALLLGSHYESLNKPEVKKFVKEIIEILRDSNK